MRALRIIYLWKLYNSLTSLGLRTGAVSSERALWKYLLKAGACQPVSKHHLSIYFTFIYNIYSILQCLKTHKKQLSIDQTFLLKLLSQNTKNGVSGGVCRLTPPLAARSLSLDANTSFWTDKDGWTVNLVPRVFFKAREKRPGHEVVGRSVSVPKYLFQVYTSSFFLGIQNSFSR